MIDDAIMTGNFDAVDKLSDFHKGLGVTDKTKFNHFRASMMDFMHLDDAHAASFGVCMDKFFNHLFSKF